MSARSQDTTLSPASQDLITIDQIRQFMEEHETQHGPQHGEIPAPVFYLTGAGATDRVELNESLYNVLKQAVEALHRGQSVTIASRDEEITTQQAAEILGISRPTVVELIKSGELPAHIPGASRRKLFLSDVMDYRDKLHERRDAFISFSSKEYGDVAPEDVAALIAAARRAK